MTFDIFLLILIITGVWYSSTHCGKCHYTKTRCKLCDYAQKHAEEIKERKRSL